MSDWHRTIRGAAYHAHRRAQKRAEESGIEFSITVDYVEELLIEATKVPSWDTRIWGELEIGHGDRDTSPSIDRIDNRYGYIEGNVAVIPSRMNMIKSAGNSDEHLSIAVWIERQLDRDQESLL